MTCDIQIEKESDKVIKQINELKDKLKEVKKTEKKMKKQETKKVKEPKPKKTAEEQKEYMRNYMRQYGSKNREQEKNRRLTGYYVKKYQIPDDFKNEFNNITCKAWKTIECMKQIKNDHPDLYPKLFNYI